MRDRRVVFLRGVFDGLVESLDATLRISRWTGTDLVPDPLKAAAAALVDRLGTANRLAADRFAGSPHVVASMVEISGGIKRLDNAYVEFRRSLAGNPTQKDDGAVALDAELATVKSEASRWT